VKLRSLEFNFGGEWGMKKRMKWKREKIETLRVEDEIEEFMGNGSLREVFGGERNGRVSE
jgi:hypothetical protein